jgi:hypothetical protein
VVTVEVMGALLRWVPFERVESDPRYAAPLGPQDRSAGGAVATVTDELRDALDTTTDEERAAVVEPRMRTDELQLPGWELATPEIPLTMLGKLRSLATSARRSGMRLYCYWV